MKISFNRLSILLVLLTTVVFTACEKDVSEVKVGTETVSIPQAFTASNSDNNHEVPGSINYGAAVNFQDDDANNKVNVFLGVSKSGEQDTQPFTVDIVSRPDTINELITAGKNFVLLPQTAYTLPSSVSFVAGQTTVSFNMVIDKTILKTYAGKKVAACVAIANPTKYVMNSAASKVVVIIDVNALNLK